MAISQTATGAQTWSTDNPVTFAFDCNAGDLLVFGFASYEDVTNVGVPTYNGVNMTDSGQGTVTQVSSQVEQWYLVSPASGSNTVSISNPDGRNIAIFVSAWSGVDTGDPLDTSASNTGTDTTPSTLITTVAINELIIDIVYNGQGTIYDSNSHTLISEITGKASQYTLDDGTGGVTLSWIHSNQGNWVHIVAAFNPEGVAPPAGDIESVLGVAWSDIHSIAGVLKADIQSVAGVDAQ